MMNRRLARRTLLRLATTAPALATTATALAATPATLAKPRDRAAAANALKWPIKLSGNENPWGPGPAARAALAACVDESCRYGMSAYGELAEAIAKREGVSRENILIGSGSGELLHMLAVAWCDRGQLVCAWPTFAQLTSYAEKMGCEIRRVPLDAELRHDLGALATAVSPNTSLLYLCNPNNPTGTAIAAEPLRAFVREMQRQTLVVVDEAYLELAEDGVTGSLVDLVKENLNVIVLRTFSKIHGLAGLRVGYGIAPPPVIQRLRRYAMTTPSTPGLRAAIASLGDTAWLAETRGRILADRARLGAALEQHGIPYAKPQGNFVFAKVGMSAEEFRKRLAAERIEVGRTFEPLRDWSRITVGTSAETTALIETLPKVLKA